MCESNEMPSSLSITSTPPASPVTSLFSSRRQLQVLVPSAGRLPNVVKIHWKLWNWFGLDCFFNTMVHCQRKKKQKPNWTGCEHAKKTKKETPTPSALLKGPTSESNFTTIHPQEEACSGLCLSIASKKTTKKNNLIGQRQISCYCPSWSSIHHGWQ